MIKILQDIPIGQNIKRIRKSRNLTQEDIVWRLQQKGRNMEGSEYAHLEEGTGIFASDLVLLQQILEVDLGEFFKELPLKTK